MTLIADKPIDPKALKEALELVSRARDQMLQMPERLRGAPCLGIDFLYRNGRLAYQAGEISFEIQHDPDSRTGIFWTVQVCKGKRLIMVAAGSKEQVEQRFAEWHEVLTLLAAHREKLP